jgi:hypothetical protein
VTDLTARIAQLVNRFGPGRIAERDRPATASSMPAGSGDAGFAETVARLVSMPLDQYACDGELLEFRVPWYHETLWFVPADRDVDSLGVASVSRGRIWTARELIALMSVPDVTPAIAESLARAKMAIDGDIVEVRPQWRGTRVARDGW